MTFDKLTEREIDIYWSGREEEQDDVIRKLIHEKSQYDQFIQARPDRSDINTYHTISRTIENIINLVKWGEK